MKNILQFITIGLLAFSIANAQTTEKEMLANPAYTASNYALYPEPGKDVKLTKAPAGYKPFYISHYGRHGSRYHNNSDEYKYLFETLAKADSVNALTATGKKVLSAAQFLVQNAEPRTGDLTQVGVRQHQGIATRMQKNFPEIFRTQNIKGKQTTPHIDIFASTSGRCIVSMAAFTGVILSRYPDLDIRYESGKSLLKFICPFNWNDLEYSKAKAYTDESDKLWKNVDSKPLMKKIFSDSIYVKSNIDADNFYNRLFEINTNTINLDSSFIKGLNAASNGIMDSLFTVEESITRWKAQNAWWYSIMGTSPLIASTHGIDFGKNTLKNILDEADKAIAIDTSSTIANGEKPITATLRFGHDTGLLPLAGLMQLDFASAKVSDLSKLHEQWTDFRIIPMAANLQIVFYKSTKKGAPILVKFLYNEREVAIPQPCSAEAKCPYYKWEDVKAFYLDILGVNEANISHK